MKYYIFLDIDGVLNNTEYIEKCYKKNGGYPMSMNCAPFNPIALNNLMKLAKRIRREGELKIILSSTWRLRDTDIAIVNSRLAEYGMNISDLTPRIEQKRGLEIQEFLYEDTNQERDDYTFVILDDEDFDIKKIYPDNLVKVNSIKGFRWRDYRKALKILEII